jgi:Mn2+/Fe2+ NRAMP family transporter
LQAPWFYVVYIAVVLGSAVLVWFVPNLVWLNIGAQVINAFMLPLVIGFLIALATKTLPMAQKLRGTYLWVLIALATVICILGIFGGISGLL